jgi:hypothetical protein
MHVDTRSGFAFNARAHPTTCGRVTKWAWSGKASTQVRDFTCVGRVADCVQYKFNMSNRANDTGHTYGLISPDDAELGPDSAGQSGDIQGLSTLASADSESVVELLEEGQFSEAETIAAMEDSSEGDGSEVEELHTKQIPTDDVPDEYLEQD